MDDQQKAAYIAAQTVCAQIKLVTMLAANEEAKLLELESPYHAADFERIPLEFGIHHNAVIGFFHSH